MGTFALSQTSQMETVFIGAIAGAFLFLTYVIMHVRKSTRKDTYVRYGELVEVEEGSRKAIFSTVYYINEDGQHVSVLVPRDHCAVTSQDYGENITLRLTSEMRRGTFVAKSVTRCE